MKTLKIKIAFLILMLPLLIWRAPAQTLPDRQNLFDSGWRFHRGGAQGAENPAFDDSAWRIVDLPHDWSIEDLPGTSSPFNIDAISQVNGGFTTGGTGWYRKSFTVPAGFRGRNVRIRFDGVYMNAEIWLNGQYLGNHPYGYTSFWFDITSGLNFSGTNLIAVKVENEGENSRWYSGSGIYRHVWLEVLSPVDFETWGTYITTPQVSDDQAIVRIRTTIANNRTTEKKFRLVTKIVRMGGSVTQAETDGLAPAGGSRDVDQELTIPKPSLWSPDSPDLYSAVSEVYTDGMLTGTTSTIFGIRSVSVDPANGFMLNGKQMKLRGGCVHHDNGPLGARAYDRAEERRVEILKANGFNAVRSSHNPPSPAFLDACDRLGMLVIDEAFDMWSEAKNPADYHLYFNDWWKRDIQSMVVRDRNHPSVIIWSIGNEIPNRHKPEVVEKAATLAAFVRELDPTRPVTSAVNDLKPDKDPYFATLDIAGYNYASGGDHNQQSLYALDHSRVPGRIMMGTESFPLEAFGSWMDVVDNPYVIGDFVWTAFDYIGEASIGWRGYWQKRDFFPWNLAYCGDIDICGWKRPQSYYRDVLWKQNQMSVWVTPPQPSFDPNPERQSWSKWHWHDVVANWNWTGMEGKPMEVTVYSSYDQAELFLNGKSYGKRPTNRSTQFMATWQVPYQPGTLRAIGFNGKKKAGSFELKSSGVSSQIRLIADRTSIKADGQDLSYVTVELADRDGVLNPAADELISFEIDGPASIVSVANGNPLSLESYQLHYRKAWHGKCLVIIKSGTAKGPVTLRASSRTLGSASLVIRCV